MNNTKKKLVVQLTHSGDRYKAAQDDWQLYREAVRKKDWEQVMKFETGGGSFEYCPDE